MTLRCTTVLLGVVAALASVAPASAHAAPPAAGAKPAGTAASSGAPSGPLYKPSSKSAAPLDISTNVYGAFSLNPNAPKIGDKIADFVLPSTEGPFRFEDARKKAEVVIIFYRGDW